MFSPGGAKGRHAKTRKIVILSSAMGFGPLTRYCREVHAGIAVEGENVAAVVAEVDDHWLLIILRFLVL